MKCCREVLKKGCGEVLWWKCCREVSEKSLVEGSCGEVL